MNIFHKVARQGMKKNRTRTFVTIVGVLLSTALFTAIAVFGTSLVGYMVDSEIAKGGNWHITFSDVGAFRLQERMNDKEVSEAVFFENIGYALLEGADEQSAEKPYLFIAGFSEESFEKLPVRLTSGRKPENGSEIIVPADSIAAKAGIRIYVKDTLTLSVGERECDGKVLTQCDPYTEGESLITAGERTYTVVGTFEKTGFEVHSSPGYTVITKADDTEQADSYSLYVSLKNPRDVWDYRESKKGESAYGINEDLLRFMGISDNRVFNTLLYTVGGVLAAIIMTGSVFLIYNSFNISLNERTRQYGILMSAGATARQLCDAVVYEGICIGCIGIPFGMAAGVGCVSLLLPAVAKNFASIINYGETLTLKVSFPAFAGSALVSLATILISAYIPAKKAVSTPIMECIRQSNEIKTGEKAVRISKWAWKLYGLEGTLALKNFKRNKRRYRSIVLSLTLSVILTVTGSTFGTILKNLGKAYGGQKADGDVSFITQDMTQEEFERLYQKMSKLEGIENCTWQADCFYKGRTDGLPDDFLAAYREAMGDNSTGPMQQMTLYTLFIEDDIYEEYIESLGLSVEEYRGTDGKILVCLMNTEEHTTFFAGDSIQFTLESAAGGEEVTVCATFEDSYPLDEAFIQEEDFTYRFIVTAPLSAKARFEGLETADGRLHLGALFWSESPTEVLRQIQALIVDNEIMVNYNLINLSQAFESIRSITFIIDIFTYVFVFMISLIAVANVFNTMSTNIRLRRREFAMLRSVGMSDKGFNRMMRFECVFYGMHTLFIGIPAAMFLSWLIHKVIVTAERRDSMAFTFPWGAIGISVLGVFGIVYITMAYVTGKIRKENIIDALRDEMT